jgi:hypothetical protein
MPIVQKMHALPGAGKFHFILQKSFFAITAKFDMVQKRKGLIISQLLPNRDHEGI